MWFLILRRGNINVITHSIKEMDAQMYKWKYVGKTVN